MTASDETSGGESAFSGHAIPGHFDPDDIEDSSNPYPRPLFLVPLPPLACQMEKAPPAGDADVLAYGADDGCIYLLHDGNEKPRVVRKYDDEVKALAVSSDGLRVSVGFDDGCTKIYSYDDFVPVDGGDAVHHPFIPPKSLAANPSSSNDDDDDNDGYLSQAIDGPSQDDAAPGEVEFDGPRMDAPIRQMAFDPRGGRAGRGTRKRVPYFLAIASESGNQPLAVVDAADGSTARTAYLDAKGADEHEMGGARSAAYSVPSGDAGNVLLATLGMDGNLVTWDVSDTDDPELLWDVCHKDHTPVVPRNDAGAGGDAGDKGCRLAWDAVKAKGGGSTTAVLFLPGRTDIQYRLCPLSKSKGGNVEALTTQECNGHLKGPSKFIVDAGGNGHKDTIVAMAVPPLHKGRANDRSRIATGGRDGKLLVWDLDLEEGTGEAREVALERRATTFGVPPITSISWGEEEELRVAFADGTVLTAPVPEGKAEGGGDEGDELDEAVGGLATQPMGKDAEENAPAKGKIASRNDDSEIAKDVTKKDASSKKKKKKDVSKDASKFIDDEAEGDDDDEIEYDDAIKISDKENNDQENIDAVQPTALGGGNDNDEDMNMDDDDAFRNHDDPVDFGDADAIDANHGLPPLQPAFAPSSTPLGEPRRILCWNHVGVVTLRADASGDDGGGDPGLGLVDIAFHETAGLAGGRRPTTLTDSKGYIVGTLGEEGGMFASDLLEDPDDDADDDRAMARRAVRQSGRGRGRGGSGAGGSSVHFHRFETFGRREDKDWVVDLPTGERAMGCATGAGWAAVITSRRFLRLFTVSGIQGPVHWIPGEPVTVVGRDRFVAVFYHRSAGSMRDGTQSLGYSIVDGITGAPVASGELSALSPGASLAWAGFTDKCALAAMDSEGVLSMLARHSNSPSANAGGWMPMLDTAGLRKGAGDAFWPVEVHGGRLLCVPLRGGRDHPDPGRRPVTTSLKLRIPLATGLTFKSGPLEEGSVRGIFALNQEKVLDDYLVSVGDADEDEVEEEYIQKCNQVDKVTLKLFSSVVQSGKVERGYDLVQRLHSEKSYDIAIKMADRIGHRKLSDRIDEARLRKYPPLDEEEEEDEFDDDAASFESAMRRGQSELDDYEPAVPNRQQRARHTSRGISPEGEGGGGTGVLTPRTNRSRAREAPPDPYPATDEESPPRESLKRQFDEDDVPSSGRRINPFAKKRVESPARGLAKAPHGTPTKLSLSRSSTFSTTSRRKQRRGKQIV